MNQPHSEVGGNTQTQAPYVGFWLRVCASIIDTILIYIGTMIVMIPFAIAIAAITYGKVSSDAHDTIGLTLTVLSSLFLPWLYYAVSESSKWQATLGKKLLGMKVTDLSGNRLGFGRATVRYWSKILSGLALMIGYVMVAFTQRKQGLHDIIADTLVVRKSKAADNAQQPMPPMSGEAVAK